MRWTRPPPPASPFKDSKRGIFRRSLRPKFTATPTAQTKEHELAAIPVSAEGAGEIDNNTAYFTPESSLRDQLELQQQLTTQFEVDLAARDELVSLLSAQLQEASAGVENYRKEVENRRGAMRALRRKVTELETICRRLEEEVERSREESFERSVMDEASEGALVALQGSIGQLKGELERSNEKIKGLQSEKEALSENIKTLQGDKEALNFEREHAAQLTQRIVEREQEAEQLRAQMDKMKRDHCCEVDEKSRDLDEALQREEILRRQVHDLQQESADKDMKLLQLNKARVQDKEDKEGLNIALDSKQQELELLKRKLGLKGTGGSTPAPNRVGLPDPVSRRQSVAFATPSAHRPRPSSAALKATPSGGTPAVNKARFGTNLQGNGANYSAQTSSTAKSVRSGPMGPPPLKRTPTPLSASTSSLARSTSSRAHSVLPVGAHRRSSSAMSMVSVPPSDDEKENAAPSKTARLSQIPA